MADNNLHPLFRHILKPLSGDKIRTDIFGWFEKAEDKVPSHDPGLETICPICGKQLQKPLKTISLMKDGDSRSYFYRTHKDCYNNTSWEDIQMIEGSLIDTI